MRTDGTAVREPLFPPPDVAPLGAPPPTPAPPPPAPPPSRRRWPWVVAGIGGTLVVAFLGLGVLGLWLAGQPIIDDDLNGGTGPFVVESDPLVDLRYEDGGYAMTLAPVEGGQRQVARSVWEISQRSVDLGVSYEVRKAPDEWAVGVGCVGSGATYWFLASGDTAVLLIESNTIELLATETIDGAPSSGRLELTCSKGAGSAPTEIVGSLNGDEVVRASHPRGFGSFRAIGIGASLEENAEMDVLWDDVSVRSEI